MNAKTTFWLLMAVLMLGTFIWVFERQTESTATRVEYGARVLRFVPDRVSFLDVRLGDWAVRCRRIGSGWFLATPAGARADEACITRILDRLDTLPKVEVVTRRQRERRGLTL